MTAERAGRDRPDRDRAHPARARAPRRRLPDAMLHRGRAGVLRLEGESRPALRGPVRREGSGREGARVGRVLHLARDRDPRPPQARRPSERPDGRALPSGSGRAHRALDDALARAGGGRCRGDAARMSLRARSRPPTRLARAEEAHPGSLDELMERAGTAVADLVAGALPGARGGRLRTREQRRRRPGLRARAARARPRGRRDRRVRRPRASPDVIVDALLGIGLQGRAARGRRPDDRADQRRREARRRGRRALRGRSRPPARCPGAAVRATATVTFGAAKVGLAVAPGRFHAGIRARRPDRPRRRPSHEHALLDAVGARRPFRARGREHEVPGRARARRRRLARPGRGAGARGDGRVPRRCRLRHARRAGVVAARAGGAGARGGEAGAARGSRRAAACRGGRARCWSSPSVPMQSCSGRASAEATARGTWCGRCSSGSPCRSSSTPTRLWELEPFLRSAPTVMTPHAGELARLLGTEADEIDAHRLESVRRAASRFGATVLLKGADTLVASPREGVLVAGLRASVARHRRDRRRALRRDRRVPRQGARAAARRGRGRGRPRARLAPRSAPGRPRRERPAARRSSAPSRARAATRAALAVTRPSRPAHGRRPGASACTQAAGRYQRGTTTSRRSCSIAREDALGHELGGSTTIR